MTSHCYKTSYDCPHDCDIRYDFSFETSYDILVMRSYDFVVVGHGMTPDDCEKV